jgi:hypothetical protein
MRYVCLAALAVAVSLVPGALLAQSDGGPVVSPDAINPANLTITNYQLLSQTPYTRTQTYYTYKASLTNTGPATPEITATATSAISAIVVVSMMGNLHFPPAAHNVTVDSLNTFTLLVDRTATVSFGALSWSYNAPVANAGPDQTGQVGVAVNLDGSGTTNPSGIGTVTYSWKFSKVPAGSALTALTNPTSVTPSFIPDLQGIYTILLTASNGAGTDYASVNVNVNMGPPAPVAVAGPNQTVNQGATVMLDGSGSHDYNGATLTYTWSIIQKPAGSAAVLSSTNTAKTSFVADLPTTTTSYMVQLVVNDGVQNSAPSIVTITTSCGAPTAVANASPTTVQIPSTPPTVVQLDGSKSTDPCGKSLTYQWSLMALPMGSNAKIANPTLVNPTFTPDLVGQYVVQLIVNDGTLSSTAATVMITASSLLQPTATASTPQTTVQIGSAAANPVQLQGSGTDPNTPPLPLTYHWTLQTPPASHVLLSSATAQNPTFMPDVIGNYIATLITNNGTLNSNPSSVTVMVVDAQPIAVPKGPATVNTGTKVTLDGSGSSDSNGAQLTYSWSFMTVPQNSMATLSGATGSMPTFTADVPGMYVVQLIVNDGIQNSAPATVSITAIPQTAITLSPDPLNLIAPNPGTLTVSIGSMAGTSGQVINLSILDTTIATVASSVTIPPGMTSTTTPVTPVSPGGTNIIASAPGFQPYQGAINVVAGGLTLTLSSNSVGVGNSVTGTITLNSAAPSPGVTVMLSQDTTAFVSLSTSTVTIAGGSATGTFTVTGIGGPNPATGTTHITASASGYGMSTATVTTFVRGTLSVQSGVTVAPGQTVPITISVDVAPTQNPANITLTSSDGTILTVTSPVVIPVGQTSVTAQVTGVNFGTATITASAPGYISSPATSVSVAANLSFTPSTATIGTGGTITLTLTLSGSAPTNGVTVNLSSDNTNAATVQTPVTIPQGQNTASVTVTAGSPAITPAVAHITTSTSVPGLTNATATITVISGVAISTPSPLPSGVVGTAYSSLQLTATGGTQPYTWSATGLPAGLSVSSSGLLSGTPTTAGGPFSIAVTVKDSTNPQLTASATLQITIVNPLTITTTSPLTSGIVGTAYSTTVMATGGTSSYTWSATNLPAGLTINASSGVISGTPTTAGTLTATVTVKDATMPQLTATANLSITINPTLAFTTTSPLPSGVQNTSYSTTIMTQGGTGALTFSASGLPAGLTINASSGAISGTPSTPGTSNASVTVKDSGNPQQSITGSFQITIVAQLVITTTSPLPNGVVGNPYTAQIVTTGGTAPLTFSATGLPAGLSINSSSGMISGTPATGTNGSYTVNVTVKDSTNPQQTATGSFSLTVGNVLTISTQSLQNGVVNVAYSQPVTASGGTTPYTWSATGLPAGLSINASSGVISGTPSAAGTSSVTVTVKDSTNPQMTASAPFTIIIYSPLTITTTSPLPNAVVNSSYSVQIVTTGGTAPLTFSATGLPAGLSINSSNGTISGTPSATGTSSVMVTVKDMSNPQQTANANLQLTVVNGLAITTGSPLPNGVQNSAYSTTIATVNGTAPLTFSATGLPAGLSINPSSGVISGTPSAAGTSSVVVTVKDSSTTQQTASATLSLTIIPQLVITTTSLPGGTEQTAYSATVMASGGVTSYMWSATGLPAGLSMSATGVISGTPVTGSAGSYTVNVTVKDSGNPQQTATANLSLTITAPVSCMQGQPTISITGGTVGNNLEIPLTVTLSSPLSGQITITSSNPAILLSGTAQVAGTQTLNLTFNSPPATSFGIYAQALTASGAATITATSSGYCTGTSTVTAAPSAFVLTGPNGIGNSFNIGANATQQLTVSPAQLDANGNPAQIQPLAGGQTATVTVNVASDGSVSPGSVNFSGGIDTATTTFTAGSTAGSSTITASEPAGFTMPTSGNVLPFTVLNMSLTCQGGQPVTVGMNLETSVVCTLSGAAPDQLSLTVTSNNPGALLLSPDSTSPGAASISRSAGISAGGSSTAPFYLYGLANSGTATYTATVSDTGSGGSFTLSATGTVNLSNSSFILIGLSGPGDFTVPAGSAPLTIGVESASVDGSGNFTVQNVAGGLSETVSVTSTNTSVGTITGSPVVITGGNNNAGVTFNVGNTGMTTLTASQPSGFTSSLYSSENVTVSQASLLLAGCPSVGKFLECQSQVFILGGGTAGTGGLPVSVSVTSGSVSLSANGTDAGSSSITVTIPAGGTTAVFYVYGLSSSGTASITGSATGFKSSTETISLANSAVVIMDAAGDFGTSPFFTKLSAGNQTLTVATAMLDSGNNFVQTMALAGNTPAQTVTLLNSNASVGTVPSPVTINPGPTVDGMVNVTFHPLTTGSTTITVQEPTGFITPVDGSNMLTIIVQ